MQSKNPQLCADDSAFASSLDSCLGCLDSQANGTANFPRESLTQEFVEYMDYCGYPVLSTLVYTSANGKVMTEVVIGNRPRNSTTHASTTTSSSTRTTHSGTTSMTSSTSSTSSSLPTGTPGSRDTAVSDVRTDTQAKTIGIAVGVTAAATLLIVVAAATVFIKTRSRKRKETGKDTEADNNSLDKPMLHSDHIPRPNPHEVEGSPAAGELGDFVPYWPAELPAREVAAHEMPDETPRQK
ncbi:hypothetical protein, variant [Gaeumannomyces tritici R3-111a-1]|nr:hypothetical protein, variant [Gaeumannomyces tritici R3-111a-1]EJT70981.1 hypothetical protein, variant [Gaeumannomyces tritici R3-111a-1]